MTPDNVSASLLLFTVSEPVSVTAFASVSVEAAASSVVLVAMANVPEPSALLLVATTVPN